jgi:hypothetical protein
MKALSSSSVRLAVPGLCLIAAVAAACSSSISALPADAGASASGGNSASPPDAPIATGDSGGSVATGGAGGPGETSAVGGSGGIAASDTGAGGAGGGGSDALTAGGGVSGRDGPTATGGTSTTEGPVATGGVDAPVATGGAAGGNGTGDAGNGWVTFSIPVSPEREVDILFMVDNSPSMDPKQQRLAENFPKMIQVLQQIPDPSGGQSLPNVHIGVISSDMGSGSDPIGQNCKRVLGDRGLLWGNDPNNFIASVAPNSPYANDPNHRPLATPGCGLHTGQRWISDVADPNGNGRVKNYDGNIQDVFSCLATAVGTGGCGFEHQLQSVRVALNADYPNNPQNASNQINPENIGFVRPNAYLAIVLVTDEDDCSADPDDTVNDSMFLQTQQVVTETASLRCAVRGHVCNGQPIPGYGDPSIGYQPPNPLPQPGVGFSTAFSNCTAKDQPDPNHPDHHYLPLIRVRDMIDSVSGVAAWAVDSSGNYIYDTNGNHVAIQKTPDKILVSGIIGWPPNTNLVGVETSDQYQIGIDATSLPVPQNTYWDYMPICTVPSIQSPAGGNIYKAYGGLRLKKFIDAFQKADIGGNPVQNTFSLCDADFTGAMTQIANAVVQVFKPGCIQSPLVDTDPNTPGVQPKCQAIDRVPCDNPGLGTCLASGYQENPLPECKDVTSGLPLDPANPQVNNVPSSERPCWYLYYDTGATGCQGAYLGQRIAVLQRAMTTAPAGTVLAMTCLTCPAPGHECPAQGN